MQPSSVQRSPLRVLLISHTCQSRIEGQPKARHLSLSQQIDLCVLVPDRWYHYGNWRTADAPLNPTFSFETGRVVWPWIGPAQFYLHWYPALASVLQEFRPDVIYPWEEPWGLVSAHTCWLRNRLLPKAKIISETEQNIDKWLPPPFGWCRAYTLRNADFAIARNRQAVDVLRAHGYAGAAEVVPNGVDPELLRPLDRQACRAALGFGGFVVGYAGRIVEEKGLGDLLDALLRCPPSVNLAAVGAGPFQSALERRIAELGLGERVRVLPPKPPGELAQFMNAIDCLAIPSRTTLRWKEQFGRVIIEAHACGTAVIGSDSGAIPEVIGAGGVIVPQRQPKRLAEAIVRLAGDSALRATLAAAGAAQVRQTYTWEAVARQMNSIYTRLV
jgi:glycosyltransferase involved in cell wall biosynthesis